MDVPNPRNLPLLLQFTIRGPLTKPHADQAPDPEGFFYVAPAFKLHLAVCEDCRRFFIGKLTEAANELARIGVGGVSL